VRRRRLRHPPATLEITAFLNLIVVLVPFLLSTAVFTRLAVLELALPAGGASAAEKLAVDRLQLEVVVRSTGIEVADRIGGAIGQVPRTDRLADDLRGLMALLLPLKQQFPATLQATVLAEPEVDYERLVQVMGAVRATAEARPQELFPQIAIGDAPLRAGKLPQRSAAAQAATGAADAATRGGRT
jgi:biopolymer transport protein ExbD